jgi:hypothetical protein
MCIPHSRRAQVGRLTGAQIRRSNAKKENFSGMETQDYLAAFKRVLSQVKAMELEIQQILDGVPTVIKQIVEVQRGVTKNSGNPM